MVCLLPIPLLPLTARPSECVPTPISGGETPVSHFLRDLWCIGEPELPNPSRRTGSEQLSNTNEVLITSSGQSVLAAVISISVIDVQSNLEQDSSERPEAYRPVIFSAPTDPPLPMSALRLLT